MRQGDAVAWRKPDGTRIYGVILEWNGDPDRPVTIIDREGRPYRPFAASCEPATTWADGVLRFPNGSSALDLVEAVARCMETDQGRETLASASTRRDGAYPVDHQGRVGRYRPSRSWYGQEEGTAEAEVERIREVKATVRGTPETTDIPLTIAQGKSSWPTEHLLRRLGQEEEAERLLAAVSNERYRYVLRRRFCLGESLPEIAKRLDISYDVAKSLSYDAIRQLRRSLDRESLPCVA